MLIKPGRPSAALPWSAVFSAPRSIAWSIQNRVGRRAAASRPRVTRVRLSAVNGRARWGLQSPSSAASGHRFWGRRSAGAGRCG